MIFGYGVVLICRGGLEGYRRHHHCTTAYHSDTEVYDGGVLERWRTAVLSLFSHLAYYHLTRSTGAQSVVTNGDAVIKASFGVRRSFGS